MPQKEMTRIAVTDEYSAFFEALRYNLSDMKEYQYDGKTFRSVTVRNSLPDKRTIKKDAEQGVITSKVVDLIRALNVWGIQIPRSIFKDAPPELLARFLVTKATQPWENKDSPEIDLEAAEICEVEREFGGEEIWIILPGTTIVHSAEEQFLNTMLDNILDGSRYVYFIDTQDFEAAKKLETIAKKLKKGRNDKDCEAIDERVNCALLSSRKVADLVVHRGMIIGGARTLTPRVIEVYFDGRSPKGRSLDQKTAADQAKAVRTALGVAEDSTHELGVSVVDRLDQIKRIRAVLEQIEIASKDVSKPIHDRSPWHDEAFSFSTLGNVHFHVDVNAHPNILISDLEEFFLDMRTEWKISTVSGVAEGLQRLKEGYGSIYLVHNPSPFGTMDYFATFDLTPPPGLVLGMMKSGEVARQYARNRLANVMRAIGRRSGVVVEAERVVGRRLGNEPFDWLDNLKEWTPFRTGEVNREELSGSKVEFEIHHGFDIPRAEGDNRLPTEPKELCDACEKKHIDIGGWFVFASDHLWCYRSNCFREQTDVIQTAKTQHEKLQSIVNAKFKEYQPPVKTIVEQLLGIWHGS